MNQTLSISIIHLTKFLNILLIKFYSTNIYHSYPTNIITFKQIQNLQKSNQYPITLYSFKNLNKKYLNYTH